jgi:hypothetical protein
VETVSRDKDHGLRIFIRVGAGTEQDEKACSPDVRRSCRKLVDQGDFAVLACLKENRPKLSTACRQVLVSHGQ